MSSRITVVDNPRVLNIDDEDNQTVEIDAPERHTVTVSTPGTQGRPGEDGEDGEDGDGFSNFDLNLALIFEGALIS